MKRRRICVNLIKEICCFSFGLDFPYLFLAVKENVSDMARSLKIKDYTYQLPEDRIAKQPLSNRADSKLLCYQKGEISQDGFSAIPSYLPANATLIFNNTKVIYARLYFPNPMAKSKPIEVFILEPAEESTIERAMLHTGHSRWKCFVGNNRDFTSESVSKDFIYQDQVFTLKALKPKQVDDIFVIDFEWDAPLSFAEILNLSGMIPLPPYLKRMAEESDRLRYQTVYAKQEGSVAAPTAGLHFTPEILTELEQKQIKKEYVVLHVGAGTFKPVKADAMGDHTMHSEEIIVSKACLENLVSNSDQLIAVGTTSLRTLESLFWIGWKIQNGASNIEVKQWDAYDISIPADFTYTAALKNILNYLESNHHDCLQTKTQLLIAPGYQIRSVKGLITNFHQPNSTLLLLVAAFVGSDWKRIYDYALANDFRFLSYGDSSLLLP